MNFNFRARHHVQGVVGNRSRDGLGNASRGVAGVAAAHGIVRVHSCVVQFARYQRRDAIIRDVQALIAVLAEDFDCGIRNAEVGGVHGQQFEVSLQG